MQQIQFQRLTLTSVMLLVVVLGGVNVARAGAFDPTRGSLLTLNTAPDMDLFFLSYFVGAFSGQPLSLGSNNLSSTGFNATMGGTYGGSSLAVNYVATVDQLNPFIIGWNSTGTYGSSSVSSSGFASIQYMGGPGVFQENYTESFTVGAHTAQAGLTITGLDNGTFLTYTGTIGTLQFDGGQPVPINGAFNTVTLPYIGPNCPDFHCEGGSDVEYSDSESFTIDGYASYDLQTGTQSGSLFVAPEPSSIAMFGTGLGLLGYAWRTRSLPLGLRQRLQRRTKT